MNPCHSQRPHFFRLVSSLNLTCRNPCTENAAPKLFGALRLRWTEPTQTTAPVSSASQTLSIFQFFKLWKVRGMAKHRHGPNRAETQNKLVQVWPRADSITVYLSESEHGSPVMKLKKKKKKWRKKIKLKEFRVKQASVFGWGCHGNGVHGCR